ncbi:hypothetical protein STAFG_6436 [Streptomyces afghaniensis 772]|uniref:Uncharacterized protein n=1 Tax=Streptomyces afghaniensis 772 TaxID=1283301 RepID=S4MSC0_9ACTN|nr:MULTISPECIES: hypothetical protein [Streptomyces]EPJ36512.1 hypothetical protein STAFG_6436 [Streptomyces afghaniensis 772]UOB13136.1 hypothetical protein MQE23_30605 [Streptomyces sp. HP-A2021]
MRKTLTTAATLALAVSGVLIPATSAQASTACDSFWSGAVPGYVHAFHNADCGHYFGRADSHDADWGDNAGAFRGGDDDAATSVLSKASAGLAAKLHERPGYGGGHLCLEPSEAYVHDLAGKTFSNGTDANDNISSHRWVPSSACGTFLD